MKREEKSMKKSIKPVISALMTASILLSGCSMSPDDAIEATEYVNDAQSVADSSAESTQDAASTQQSLVVVNDLFEPVLEEKSIAEASTAQSTETETTAASKESSMPDSIYDLPETKIVFFGDSQTANGRDDGTDIPSLLKERVPNLTVYNLAIGGTTATIEKTTSDFAPEVLRSTCFLGMTYCLAGKSDREATLANFPGILQTMNSIDPSEVDMYVIEYGTNDFLTNVPLDKTSDPDVGPHALYNALALGIEELQKLSPKATIILMTPFYGIYVGPDGTYIGDSYIVSNGIGTLADYAKKVTNVAEDYGLYSFDDMFMTKCDLYLDTAGEYLMDNLHLSLKGRQIFARLLAHQINVLLEYEPYAYLEADFIKIAEFDPNEIFRYDEGQMREYFPESWSKYINGKYPLAKPSDAALELYKDDITND